MSPENNPDARQKCELRAQYVTMKSKTYVFPSPNPLPLERACLLLVKCLALNSIKSPSL